MQELVIFLIGCVFGYFVYAGTKSLEKSKKDYNFLEKEIKSVKEMVEVLSKEEENKNKEKTNDLNKDKGE